MSRVWHRRWRGRTGLCREGLGLEHPLKELQPNRHNSCCQMQGNCLTPSLTPCGSLPISSFQWCSWPGPRVPSQPLSELVPVENHLSLAAYREKQVFLKTISTEYLFYYTWGCKNISIYYSFNHHSFIHST